MNMNSAIYKPKIETYLGSPELESPLQHCDWGEEKKRVLCRCAAAREEQEEGEKKKKDNIRHIKYKQWAREPPRDPIFSVKLPTSVLRGGTTFLLYPLRGDL